MIINHNLLIICLNLNNNLLLSILNCCSCQVQPADPVTHDPKILKPADCVKHDPKILEKRSQVRSRQKNLKDGTYTLQYADGSQVRVPWYKPEDDVHYARNGLDYRVQHTSDHGTYNLIAPDGTIIIALVEHVYRSDFSDCPLKEAFRLKV